MAKKAVNQRKYEIVSKHKRRFAHRNWRKSLIYFSVIGDPGTGERPKTRPGEGFTGILEHCLRALFKIRLMEL